MAGLKTFWPMPPKGSLATQIQTTAPMNTIHRGIEDGRFIASSRPVTTADRSPTVEGRFNIQRVTAHSSSTQEATLTSRTSRCINYESSLVPMVFGAGAETLSKRSNTEKNCRKKNGRELFDVHG